MSLNFLILEFSNFWIFRLVIGSIMFFDEEYARNTCITWNFIKKILIKFQLEFKIDSKAKGVNVRMREYLESSRSSIVLDELTCFRCSSRRPSLTTRTVAFTGLLKNPTSGSPMCTTCDVKSEIYSSFKFSTFWALRFSNFHIVKLLNFLEFSSFELWSFRRFEVWDSRTFESSDFQILGCYNFFSFEIFVVFERSNFGTFEDSSRGIFKLFNL